ncbi:MAG: SRPBCC family protein [bacterium]
MPRAQVIVDIQATKEKVWHLLTDAKEMEFWCLNIRDLLYEPAGPLQVGTIRKARIEVNGKIHTLHTEVTHCEPPNFFSETPCGGTADWLRQVKSARLTYRLEAEHESETTLILTGEYELEGLWAHLFDRLIGEGMVRTMMKQNLERLKTYAETGRVV